MTSASQRRTTRHVARWFAPHWDDVGMWAFILNRLSGIGLTIYLFLHLIVLGTLARGPAAYDSFIALAKSPVFVLGELVVVAGGLYHGLNGVRIVLTSFGIGVARERLLFFALLALVAAGVVVFAVRMFG